MAQGISRAWVTDGPVSRVSQARYRTAQARAECKQVEPRADGMRDFCPKHSYNGCPVAAGSN